MPLNHPLRALPHQRHTLSRQPDNRLYHEQVLGTRGFEGIQSIVYHRRAPTAILKAEDRGPIEIALEPSGALSHRHFRTRQLVRGGDFITGRQPLLHNNDVTISVVLPAAPMDYHYRNGQGDELVFVDQGEGRIESLFGMLPFRRGDYLVIPIGTTYRIVFDTPAVTDLPQRTQRSQRMENAGSASVRSVSSVAAKL